MEDTVRANEQKISELEKNLNSVKNRSLEFSGQKDREGTSGGKGGGKVDLGWTKMMKPRHF